MASVTSKSPAKLMTILGFTEMTKEHITMFCVSFATASAIGAPFVNLLVHSA